MPGPLFWFLALLGLLTLAVSVWFALRPAERTLDLLQPLCSATVFASLAAFFAGVANGLVALGRSAAAAGEAPPLRGAVLAAAAEAPLPLVLGCAVVSVAWLLVALGSHRRD